MIPIENYDENELVKEHRRLIYHTIKTYYPYYYNKKDEDFAQIGFIGLLHAIRTFNDKKNKFSTYATKCIYNELSKHIILSNYDKRKINNNLISLEFELYEGDDKLYLKDMIKDKKNNDYEIAEYKMVLHNAIKQLNELERKIIQLELDGYKNK